MVKPRLSVAAGTSGLTHVAINKYTGIDQSINCSVDKTYSRPISFNYSAFSTEHGSKQERIYTRYSGISVSDHNKNT